MEFVMKCDVCKRCKHETVAPPGLLQPLATPDQAWSSISMNFIEGLPRSKGKDCILVIVDQFTKFAHFLGLFHPFTAQEVARVFLHQVVKLHGVPQNIVSNRDKLFTSLKWKELLNSLGIKLHMSTAYHPQTNGQIESVNCCADR